jgi:hypothetical protein
VQATENPQGRPRQRTASRLLFSETLGTGFMTWRATALALATTFAALADEPKWTYARLVDAPIAPLERTAQVKILKVIADPGPTDDDVADLLKSIPTEDAKPGSIKSPREKAVRLRPDFGVDPVSKLPLNTWRVFVGGEVVRPGAFNAQRPFTALQAVMAAGGLKNGGEATEIVVLRYRDKDAPPKKKSVDLSASLAGKGVNDLWLESHDVVLVPKSGSSNSAEEAIKGLPIPVANSASKRMREIHRMKLEASEASGLRPLSLLGN